MKLKRLCLLATLAGSAAVASAPVFADRGGHEGRGWRGEYRHGHHYHPRYSYAPPPRVIYVPQVVYAAPPAPVYYPAPRYYQPAPVYAPAPVHSGISIRFRLPL